MVIVPPYLEKGDTIGIVCPAGFMPREKIAACITTLQNWGYKVKVGTTPGHQYHYFAGTDEERLEDLQNMLDDDNIKAVLCGRGGYGVSRIIDQISWKRFKKKPKWIIGYSDITLLHGHIQSQLKVASLHSPMAGAFNDTSEEDMYLQSLQRAISGKKMKYNCEPYPMNRRGKAEGALIGGNLAMLAHMIGSPSEYATKGRILFIEDVGEYLYNVDRMLMQLKRSGKLEQLSGLVVGAFTEIKDTTIPFGQTVYGLVWDKVKDYDYPVCFNFPVGHLPENFALKVGVPHSLSVKTDEVKLTER